MTRVMRVGAAQMGPRKDRQADEAICVKNFDFFCLPFQSHSTFMVLPFSVTNLETSMALVKTCWLRKERRRTVSCSGSYKGELASIFLMPAAARACAELTCGLERDTWLELICQSTC